MTAYLARLKRVLLADKKKSGVMVALVAVGLLLWGRLLLKQVPKTATATPEAVASATDDRDAAWVARPKVEVDWPDGLARDLFAFEADRYKPNASENPEGRQPKSDQAIADRNQRVEDARRAARSLTLQSVVSGAQPNAIINGRLMEVGDTIEGFELIEIHERSVILDFDTVRVRLSL